MVFFTMNKRTQKLKKLATAAKYLKNVNGSWGSSKPNLTLYRI